MNAFSDPMTPAQCRLAAINHWFDTYDNQALRRHCPSTYHDELLRQADEMDRLRLIDWTEWRDLRRLADRAFVKAVAGADYHLV
ncbi:hypothetical protein EON09_04640 [Pseudomonas soli]|jgi:hypothetical protein|uniref:Uncharacterized protein n=1 Tax=Pseudomonas soli TaxID=1306993 RepID=A0A1H8ZBM9_9PSED|nr:MULTISPECIES: hypothetical protein [Pseudomonas]AIN58611.1 hypothetical protein O165_010090 [Pseudomonas soli]MDT3716709.1 hypothetical protein [Pseudomonas soli]MDT3733540.1 hypothetical protein [Pseudomonas soli]MDX2310486.1 hypothetical protein [Pseudomonas sp. On1]MEE1880755.1 hypothetical protein [Pseudomonas soli]